MYEELIAELNTSTDKAMKLIEEAEQRWNSEQLYIECNLEIIDQEINQELLLVSWQKLKKDWVITFNDIRWNSCNRFEKILIAESLQDLETAIVTKIRMFVELGRTL